MWSKTVAEGYDPLPLTVTLHEHEPATSFISRLAARNGLKSVQEFCRDIRFPYLDLISGDATTLLLLSKLGNCDLLALEGSSFRNLNRNSLRLRDEIATSQSLHRRKVRVCPRCVVADVGRQANYWRAWRRLPWQFKSIRSCPEHGCELLELPQEGSAIRGYDYAAQVRDHWATIANARPVEQRHTDFEAWLSARIKSVRGASWIDKLELNVASRTCEVFGLLLEKGPEAALSGHSARDWASYADRGFQIMRGGSDAFDAALEDLLQHQYVDRRFFSKVYGPLTNWLGSRSLGPEFEPIREIVREVIVQNFNVRRGVLVLGKPSEGKSTERRDRMEVTVPKELSALMLQRGLARHGTEKDVVPMGFVTHAMIKAIKYELSRQAKTTEVLDRPVSIEGQAPVVSGVMTVGEVAKRLKITAPTVMYLIRNGFLELNVSGEGQRKGSVFICPQSVARFESVFVSLGMVAARSKQKQGALVIKLRNLEVPMLATPPNYSGIFWKEDVAGFEL